MVWWRPPPLRFVTHGVVGFLVLAGACGSSTHLGSWPVVSIDVLNEAPGHANEIIIVRGDPVEVRFEVHASADTSLLDSIQLRRVDDHRHVSYGLRGDELSGTVHLSTTSEDALGRLKVIYVHMSGPVLAEAEDTVVVVEDTSSPGPTVFVPSREAPTLQAGVDRVSDGGVVAIEPGEYTVDPQRPIVITDKSITIRGAGSIRNAILGVGEITRLVAPPPTGFVDAERATGLINYVRAGGVLRDLDVSGGDACVLGRDLEGAKPLRLQNATLSNTGRGVLWMAPSKLSVAECEVMDCSWNGITITRKGIGPSTVNGVTVENIANIGIYLSNSEGYFDAVTVVSCTGGGIVVKNSLFGVVDSLIGSNSFAGIALYESAGVIEDNRIAFTYPIPSGPMAGRYGDGVAMFLCPLVRATGNLVDVSARAGIASFGSTMHLGWNRVECAQFDLEGEPVAAHYLGWNRPPQTTNFVVKDLGGNLCGCPLQSVECGVQSPNPSPPGPISPIE